MRPWTRRAKGMCVCPHTTVSISDGRSRQTSDQLMPGITVGDNTVVEAGRVVTRDLPSNLMAVGVPCRKMREIQNRGGICGNRRGSALRRPVYCSRLPRISHHDCFIGR